MNEYCPLHINQNHLIRKTIISFQRTPYVYILAVISSVGQIGGMPILAIGIGDQPATRIRAFAAQTFCITTLGSKE